MSREEAIEILKERMKPDDIIYTQLEHVTKSGMTRFIKVRLLKPDHTGECYPYNWTHTAAVALGWTFSERYDAIKVGGCGMDMGFHLVSNLSRVLYDDDYALKQRWL